MCTALRPNEAERATARQYISQKPCPDLLRPGHEFKPSSFVPHRRVIVVVHLAVSGAVRPIPIGALAVFGRTFKLVLGYADPIAAKIGVVFQIGPWHRIVILSHAEETTEGYDCVCDFAADFVDHNALDAADLPIVSSIDCRTFHLVASDQRHGLASRI